MKRKIGKKLGALAILAVTMTASVAVGTSLISATSLAQITAPEAGPALQQSFKAEIEDAVVLETGKDYVRIAVMGAVWNVNVKSSTTVIRRYGGNSTLSQIRVGDIVDV